jgi:TipAS antibiotic-recognition domain
MREALSSEQMKSLAKTDNWSHVDKQRVHIDWDALYKELTPMMQHLPASAPEIQALIACHYSIVSHSMRPRNKLTLA